MISVNNGRYSAKTAYNETKNSLFVVTSAAAPRFDYGFLTMTHPLIQQIATELDVSVEDVNAVISGEMLPNDSNLYRIMKALGANGRGVYVCAVWKGEPAPNALRNMPTYDFFGQILEALNLTLDKKGYTSRLLVTSSELMDYRFFEDIISRHPDVGLINVASSFTGELQRACEDYRRPLLYFDYPIAEDASAQYIISVDGKPVMAEVVEHLYALGHRRIAFICGPLSKVSSVARVEGYRLGLKNAGLDYDPELVEVGTWHHPSGEAAAEKFLALDDRPTAIIASNDLMAFGAMQTVENHGLKIPDDISIVGYDDIAETEMKSPPLASVRTPMSDMGAKAGEYMIELLEGRTPEPRHVYFPLEIMYRESIGPAPLLVSASVDETTTGA